MRGQGLMKGRQFLSSGSKGVFSASPVLQSLACRRAAFALHPSLGAVVEVNVLQVKVSYRILPPELDLNGE